MTRKPKKISDAKPAPKHSANKTAIPLESRSSFSVKEFCDRVGIARGTFLNLRKAGLGPKEMRLSGTPYGGIRISVAAEAAWIADCEKRTVDEAEQVAARAKRAPKIGA